MFQSYMNFFLLLNTEKVFLKNVCNQTVEKVNGMINSLVTDILQNIFFYVQQKKETYRGLRQLEGEKMMKEFAFLTELPLSFC